MDLIGVCAMSIAVHLVVNRCFGHLRGWLRMAQGPSILLGAIAMHLLAVSGPLAWLIAWQASIGGYSALAFDVAMTLFGALLAARLMRRAARR